MHYAAVLFFFLLLLHLSIPRPAAVVGADAGAGAGTPAAASSPALLPCLEEVLPCTAYLKSDRRPAQTCCTALNRVAGSEMPCLCQLLADPGMLADFNVTKEQALRLPTRCGLPVGCRAGSVGISEPVVEAPPPPPAVRAPRHAGIPSSDDRCRTGSVWCAIWTVLFAELFLIPLLF